MTKSSMKIFDKPSETLTYDKESKKVRSTVLDYPDMEKVPMTSVHQQGKGIFYLMSDFLNDAKLDRKSLIVDTASFIKDLKSTHFSVSMNVFILAW